MSVEVVSGAASPARVDSGDRAALVFLFGALSFATAQLAYAVAAYGIPGSGGGQLVELTQVSAAAVVLLVGAFLVRRDSEYPSRVLKALLCVILGVLAAGVIAPALGAASFYLWLRGIPTGIALEAALALLVLGAIVAFWRTAAAGHDPRDRVVLWSGVGVLAVGVFAVMASLAMGTGAQAWPPSPLVAVVGGFVVGFACAGMPAS